jgi:hypothetical protein
MLVFKLGVQVKRDTWSPVLLLNTLSARLLLYANFDTELDAAEECFMLLEN